MRISIALVFGLVIACSRSGAAHADEPTPPPPCSTKNIATGAPDPDPRNVTLIVSQDNSTAQVYVCIASNAPRLSDLTINVAVFDAGGNFLSSNLSDLGAINPIDGATPNQPNLMGFGEVNIPLKPGMAGKLSPTVLVELSSTKCENAGPDPCKKDSEQNTFFLRSAPPASVKPN